MLACPGCGGRNLPEVDVCAFCNRRVGAQANGSRQRRLANILVAALLLALLISVVLLVLSRSASVV